jgi:hypothetical protein
MNESVVLCIIVFFLQNQIKNERGNQNEGKNEIL